MELPKLSRVAASIALCTCLAVSFSAMAIGSSDPETAASPSLRIIRSNTGLTAHTVALGLSVEKASWEQQTDNDAISSEDTDGEEAPQELSSEELSEEPSDDTQSDSEQEDVPEDSSNTSLNTDTSEDTSTDSGSISEPATGSEPSNLSFPAAGTVSTSSTGLNLRSGPGSSYAVLVSIPNGTSLTLTGMDNNWYQVSYNGYTGYVSSQYVTLGGSTSSNTSAASGTSESVSSNSTNSSDAAAPASSSSSPAPSSSSSSEASDTAAQLVEYAKEFLGCSYVYATAGPDTFDCSGFTSYVFAHFGYTLNRSAAGQYNNGTVIEIDESQMKAGDLLLWRAYGSSSAATHAGIYIGNGQYIHASSTAGCVVISSLTPASTQRYLVGVRRIISD